MYSGTQNLYCVLFTVSIAAVWGRKWQRSCRHRRCGHETTCNSCVICVHSHVSTPLGYSDARTFSQSPWYNQWLNLSLYKVLAYPKPLLHSSPKLILYSSHFLLSLTCWLFPFLGSVFVLLFICSTWTFSSIQYSYTWKIYNILFSGMVGLKSTI